MLRRAISGKIDCMSFSALWLHYAFTIYTLSHKNNSGFHEGNAVLTELRERPNNCIGARELQGEGRVVRGGGRKKL